MPRNPIPRGLPVLRAAIIAPLLAATAGCSSVTTAGQVVATPLTVVRDVIDAPLVTLTNLFEFWADQSSPVPSASAGVGIGPGGVTPGLFLNVGYYLFKPFSWIFGGVDYVLGRSLWPNWPAGISPWKAANESWGSLYFPSTRALWKVDEPAPPVDSTVGEAGERSGTEVPSAEGGSGRAISDGIRDAATAIVFPTLGC